MKFHNSSIREFKLSFDHLLLSLQIRENIHYSYRATIILNTSKIAFISIMFSLRKLYYLVKIAIFYLKINDRKVSPYSPLIQSEVIFTIIVTNKSNFIIRATEKIVHI